MESYNLSRTPQPRRAIRDSVDEYASNSSISDDSAMNEFIGDPEFSIPVMEEPRFNHGDWPNSQFKTRLDAQFYPESQDPKCYYLLNFITCLLVSIAISSSVLGSSLELTEEWWPYAFQKTQQFVLTAYVLYMTITPDTYKSINCSIEFLPINWMLYNYPFARTLAYLGIQMVAATIGAYIAVGMHYHKLETIDETVLMRILMPTIPHILAIDSFALAIFAHTIVAVGVTTALNPTNSINCTRTMICALAYVYIISSLYEIAVGPISFVIYKLALYGAYRSVVGGEILGEKNTGWVLAGAGMLFKLVGFPLIAYHVKYVWSNVARRHIEYAS